MPGPSVRAALSRRNITGAKGEVPGDWVWRGARGPVARWSRVKGVHEGAERTGPRARGGTGISGAGEKGGGKGGWAPGTLLLPADGDHQTARQCPRQVIRGNEGGEPGNRGAGWLVRRVGAGGFEDLSPSDTNALQDANDNSF
ncbi:hypothetical protein NP493_1488g00005 [Ridgeia piscesae]|uniref:Uncharacterized protein n=1 Tax=Ridgeia piscesae TaxID=27915 RepID=A0AAD9NDA6_RIDPI|nr:hypothetical protein NP493_1488g00005 [Ridgeia piscesae]